VRSDSSGKTTLLNRILTEDHGLRIAVIENEFGEVDIDGSLVADQQVRILEKNPWLYTELQNRVRL
jgi:G3E family GTPase